MPIVNGNYVNPGWKDGGPPAINANELNAMSDTLESIHKVGDVLLTERTDLGNKYLLCNGDYVTDSKYDKLKPLLKQSVPIGVWASKTAFISVEVNSVQFINGKYVSIVSRTSSNSGGASVFVSSSVNGPWTQHDVYTTEGRTPSIIFFANGKYFIGSCSTGMPNTNSIHYTNNLNSAWITIAQPTAESRYMTCVGAYYTQGQYIVMFCYNDSSAGVHFVSYKSTNLSSWEREYSLTRKGGFCSVFQYGADIYAIEAGGSGNSLISFNRYNESVGNKWEYIGQFTTSVAGIPMSYVFEYENTLCADHGGNIVSFSISPTSVSYISNTSVGGNSVRPVGSYLVGETDSGYGQYVESLDDMLSKRYVYRDGLETVPAFPAMFDGVNACVACYIWNVITLYYRNVVSKVLPVIDGGDVYPMIKAIA